MHARPRTARNCTTNEHCALASIVLLSEFQCMVSIIHDLCPWCVAVMIHALTICAHVHRCSSISRLMARLPAGLSWACKCCPTPTLYRVPSNHVPVPILPCPRGAHSTQSGATQSTWTQTPDVLFIIVPHHHGVFPSYARDEIVNMLDPASVSSTMSGTRYSSVLCVVCAVLASSALTAMVALSPRQLRTFVRSAPARRAWVTLASLSTSRDPSSTASSHSSCSR